MLTYVIIPVCNRLADTMNVLRALNEQTIRKSLRIIIVDDGSTDGTDKYLSAQDNIEVLKGDGRLWWSGATQLGLLYSAKFWKSGDYVLFLNNDLVFDRNYVESLINGININQNSAIGSALYDINSGELLKLGPKIDLNKRTILDLIAINGFEKEKHLKTFYEVDALGGRGTLYKVEFFCKYGFLRPVLLPHYFADYEISIRFKKGGINLLVSADSRVYSRPEFGYNISQLGFFQAFFSNKSQKNILQRMTFYFFISNGWGKIVMPTVSLYWSVREISSYLLKSFKNDK